MFDEGLALARTLRGYPGNALLSDWRFSRVTARSDKPRDGAHAVRGHRQRNLT